MPMTYNMSADSELYRGILASDYRDWDLVPNPNYDPYSRGYSPKEIRQDVGPWKTREFVIGPYFTVAPIKTYITRHRSRSTNLRLVRVEKVTQWEEVKL